MIFCFKSAWMHDTRSKCVKITRNGWELVGFHIVERTTFAQDACRHQALWWCLRYIRTSAEIFLVSLILTVFMLITGGRRIVLKSICYQGRKWNISQHHFAIGVDAVVSWRWVGLIQSSPCLLVIQTLFPPFSKIASSRTIYWIIP